VLYNFLISTCGKSKNSDQAIKVKLCYCFFLAGIKFYLYLDFANFSLLLKILDEMKNSGVKPNGQTYICLLNACAAAGRLDPVYVISSLVCIFSPFSS
jgi:hypothetical protein